MVVVEVSVGEGMGVGTAVGVGSGVGEAVGLGSGGRVVSLPVCSGVGEGVVRVASDSVAVCPGSITRQADEWSMAIINSRTTGILMASPVFFTCFFTRDHLFCATVINWPTSRWLK